MARGVADNTKAFLHPYISEHIMNYGIRGGFKKNVFHLSILNIPLIFRIFPFAGFLSFHSRHNTLTYVVMCIIQITHNK